MRSLNYNIIAMENVIVINPKVLGGKPVIKGTRIPVSLILNLIARGYTIDRVLEAYPNLKRGDVIAAIRYAELRINREVERPLAFSPRGS